MDWSVQFSRIRYANVPSNVYKLLETLTSCVLSVLLGLMLSAVLSLSIEALEKSYLHTVIGACWGVVLMVSAEFSQLFCVSGENDSEILYDRRELRNC